MLTLGARVLLSLSTNVNTPFFQVPTPELWHRGRARVQGPDLVPWHLSDVDIMGSSIDRVIMPPISIFPLRIKAKIPEHPPILTFSNYA